MTKYHWITLVVILAIGYLLGVKFPQYGNAALSKVGM